MRVRMMACGLALTAAACINAAEPRGAIFQYQIEVHACDSLSCNAPDSIAVLTGAAPGDTVWLRHDVLLLQSVDTVATATIRPDCAENVRIEFGPTLLQSLPEPITCPDSTAPETFRTTEGLLRFTQWILDPALPPATYTVTGRVLVQPNILPSFGFVVQ